MCDCTVVDSSGVVILVKRLIHNRPAKHNRHGSSLDKSTLTTRQLRLLDGKKVAEHSSKNAYLGQRQTRMSKGSASLTQKWHEAPQAQWLGIAQLKARTSLVASNALGAMPGCAEAGHYSSELQFDNGRNKPYCVMVYITLP
jgi:hypothetical protein